MMIEVTEQASNTVLDALSVMMNGGSIELLSDDRRRLALLKLSNPATKRASGREVVFNEIGEEDAALAQGNAATARILAADGSEVFHCDVGDGNSNAVVKLNTTRIFRGGPVRLTSFRLRF
jgi:hypothetical protein